MSSCLESSESVKPRISLDFDPSCAELLGHHIDLLIDDQRSKHFNRLQFSRVYWLVLDIIAKVAPPKVSNMACAVSW